MVLLCTAFAQELDASENVPVPGSSAPLSLINAARVGNLPAVKAALDRGEDINQQGQHNVDALIMAMKHYEKDIATYLVKKGIGHVVVDDHGRNSLLWAIWRQYVEIAEILIQRGADVNVRNPDDQKTPLIYVSLHPEMKEHHHLIHMLVDAGADVNAIDKNDHSALFLSSMNGHGDCVEALLEHGAHVDHKQKHNDHTSLHAAAENGHNDVVQALLEHGADTTLVASNDGRTALELAKRNGRRKIVQMIEEKHQKMQTLQQQQAASEL
jgi:ankyrin repeat protein|tara:strand:- start:342 stop:1148 length:807 start_codon:yes stop_codon:yes gene_type:complete